MDKSQELILKLTKKLDEEKMVALKKQWIADLDSHYGDDKEGLYESLAGYFSIVSLLLFLWVPKDVIEKVDELVDKGSLLSGQRQTVIDLLMETDVDTEA